MWCPAERVKLSWIELLVLLSVFGALIGLLIPASDFDLKHRYPPPVSRSVTGLVGVAGEYYLGDGRGTNLRLSILPDGRYSFVSSGCTGVHHRESGHVQKSEGNFVLSPSVPGEPEVERALVLIEWGRRRYLIPTGAIQEFRDAVVDGREPRDEDHGTFYVRQPIAPADGLPDSPPGCADDLRAGLLLGRVLEVSAVGLASVGRAKVDLGANDGLREGDILTVQRRGSAMKRRLSVVAVANGSCVADECHPGASEHPLEPGQAVIAVRIKERTGRR